MMTRRGWIIVALMALLSCVEGLRFARVEGAFCDAGNPCAPGFFCDEDRDVCVAERALAEVCSRDQQCASGFCASGVCCENDCPGICNSCAVSGHTGACVAVPAGTDPFDDCPGTTACGSDGSCEASAVWSRQLGLAGNQLASGVAVAPGGQAVVVGSFEGAIALGTATLQNADEVAGDHDAFVVALDGENGAPRWHLGFQGLGDQRLAAAAVAPDGRVVVVGWYAGSLALPGGVILTAEAIDLFAAGLSAEGALEWVFAPALEGDQMLSDVTISSRGDIYAVGTFAGAMDVDDCEVATSGNTPAALILSLGPGACRDAFLVGGTGQGQTGRAVALDGSGDLYVAAETRGLVAVGSDATYAGGSDKDVFAFKLSGQDLSDVRWSRPFRAPSGDDGDDEVGGIAVDESGRTFIVGTFRDSWQAGDLFASSSGGSDIFFVRLGPAGAVDVATTFGSLYDQAALAIALDGSGAPAVVGRFEGRLPLGDGLVETAGGFDAFVAKLDVDGAPRYSLPIGGIMHDAFFAVAIDENDAVVVAGAFEHQVAVGTLDLVSMGGRDVLIAKLKN